MKISPFKRWTFLILLVLVAFSLLSQGYILNTAANIPRRLPESTVAIVQSDRDTAAEINYEDIRAMVRRAVNQAVGS